MWGASFEDLARKAQELQDQAAEAATSLSVRITACCAFPNRSLDANFHQSVQLGLDATSHSDYYYYK